MDFRYMDYLTDDKYYVKRTSNDKLFNIKINDNYILKDTLEHWVMVNYINDKLPSQGFKIHVSSTLNNAQNILTTVARYLIKNNISFKYVRSLEQLMIKNSKYADRSSSGKFITIYPRNEIEFEKILNELQPKVDRYKKGPYILNDKRWKNGNLYFRYGGFMPIINVINKKEIYCIKNNNGELIEDKRVPYYYLPDFITEPKFIIQSEKKTKINEKGTKKFRKFKINEAIHFSNGGGVYKAKYKEKDIILKEARNQAGLDGAFKDATFRLKNEAKILKILTKSTYTPKFIDFFKTWENYYLAQEYLTGVPLSDWLSKNFPFSYNSKNTDAYINASKNILKNIFNGLKKIHSYGIALGDLQPNNILISENNEIKFIDFETSSFFSDVPRLDLMTIGFVDRRTKNIREKDYYAFIQLIKYMFLPIGSVEIITDNLRYNQLQYIKDKFGLDVFNFVQSLINQCIDLANFKSKELNLALNLKNEYIYISECNELEIKDIINGLIESIKSDISDELFIHGDIRQYLSPLGKYNILTGAYGAILALYKTNNITENIKNWIQNHANFDTFNDYGLFTGKIGIACVLYNTGFKKEANKIFKSITKYIENNINSIKDVSILSGLAGIGLSLLSYYNKTKNENIKNTLDKIYERIILLFKQKEPLYSYDIDFIPNGFFEGWSGVSYFIMEYINTFNLNKYNIAFKMIKEDLKNCKTNEDDGSLNVKDENRLLPYILSGSAGIIYSIDKYNELVDKNAFNIEKEQIIQVINCRCYYGIGLFRGASGMFTLLPYLNDNKYTKLVLEKLNLFLIKDKNKLFTPGDFSYRLSNDVFSGSSGIVLALLDVLYNNKLGLLPLIKG